MLSIDGGGIRGIIPAIVLNYIEERTGKRIATMFDFIAGTSTGGILALGLTRKNSDSSINNEPEYTAAELVNFYRKYGQKVFKENLIGDLDDLLQPTHNPKGKQEVLKDLL
ncbi:patatin-like phospholipase family protein [Microcoleus sp. BROC3]|uniref:patatin-like phospholipase family protein n=1 Tax=Microcoleus sp. BROC3 TaxID=3055323 RepID=UPI002FD169F3